MSFNKPEMQWDFPMKYFYTAISAPSKDLLPKCVNQPCKMRRIKVNTYLTDELWEKCKKMGVDINEQVKLYLILLTYWYYTIEVFLWKWKRVELCQAQPMNYKLFGPDGAIFGLGYNLITFSDVYPSRFVFWVMLCSVSFWVVCVVSGWIHSKIKPS